MIKKVVAALVLLPFTIALPMPAAAQQEDIANLDRAMSECAVDPNYLGYINYDICVQARYQDLQQQSGYGGGGGGGQIPGDTDPFNQNCNRAASRIPC